MRRLVFVVLASCGGGLAGAGLGFLAAHYRPVLGSGLDRLMSQPWSPACWEMVPAHVAAFGVVGFAGGLVLGLALAATVVQSRRPAPPRARVVSPPRPGSDFSFLE